MKYSLLILALILGFTGCNSTKYKVRTKVNTSVYQKPTVLKSKHFHAAMIKVAKSTQKNSKYQKMTLDTPEKKRWFKSLMYQLWDRQITRHDFIDEGLRKYPERSYEFNFVANGFQLHS